MMAAMPSYLLLIVEEPGQRATRTEADGHAVFRQMVAWSQALQQRGVLRAVESLQSGGTRVQVRDGELRLVDGPFAEAKELVGGFFLVDVADQAAALALARDPAARWATVEVRATGPCCR
jgi:hypothetical protein